MNTGRASELARALARLPAQGLIAGVQAYRLLLSPWLGTACRFEPTCSAYTLQALQRYGACRGAWLGGWRLLRCHPWCAGGHDPVPERHAPAISRPISRFLGGTPPHPGRDAAPLRKELP